jgi:hypothetical protein
MGEFNKCSYVVDIYLCEGNADVIAGTILLFGSLTCTLFDSGATHSFISSSYVKLCKLSMKPLE